MTMFTGFAKIAMLGWRRNAKTRSPHHTFGVGDVCSQEKGPSSLVALPRGRTTLAHGSPLSHTIRRCPPCICVMKCCTIGSYGGAKQGSLIKYCVASLNAATIAWYNASSTTSSWFVEQLGNIGFCYVCYRRRRVCGLGYQHGSDVGMRKDGHTLQGRQGSPYIVVLEWRSPSVQAHSL